MRFLKFGCALLFLTGAAFSACGTQEAGSSGTGWPHDCTGITFDRNASDLCNQCVREKCCAEIANCVLRGPNCIDPCSFDPSSPDCAAVKDAANVLRYCSSGYCKYECNWTGICKQGSYASDGGACPDTPEPDGGVTVADCSSPYTAVLRGTVDGKPYDQTFLTDGPFLYQATRPFFLSIDLRADPFDSHHGLELYFQEVCVWPDKPPVPVSGGMVLPTDDQCNGMICWGKYRGIRSCSLLSSTYDLSMHIGIYRFNLLLDNGDQLTGCARGE
jgi:hypothetical protein